MERLQHLFASRAGLAVLAVGLGLTNAVLLLGWGPMNPTNIDWVFGDNATYYFGWEMYRHDPHLNFPLSWTDRVGYPVGASIALLDAIPLVAVVLRPLGPLLPEPFQYLGLYAALCFVLQAYFGLSLCRRLFPSQPAFILCGALFFLLSAPLTWRGFGHTALLSHWPILAGLDSYFRDPGDRPVRWLARIWVVLALSAAITPYIAALCFFVTLAAIGRLLIERRCGWFQTGVLLLASVGVLVASGASIGVLVARDASTYWAPGYGFFSLNLNALVNPMEYGSILLPALPLIHPAQTEGYNYLGLGIITLLVLGVARRPQSVLWLSGRRLVPLVGLAVLCTALAISAKVSLGSTAILDIELPTAVVTVVQGLRASGRLFWPAYYLLIVAALSLTFWVWRAPYRNVLVAAALVVQVADLATLRSKVRAVLDQRDESGLKSPAWKDLGRKYDNLILIPPYQCGPYTGPGGFYSFVIFGKLAAAERMRSNSYYAARYTHPQLSAHCVDILRTQLAGTLDPRSAYVVTDGVKTVWDVNGMQSHRCELADGFNLCTPVTSADAMPAARAPDAPAYVMGETLDFTEKGNARQYMTFGWGASNSEGTWTEGPLAMLRLGLDAPLESRPLMLTVDGGAFVVPQHPRLHVDVVVNGRKIDEWVFRSALRPASRRETGIPAELAAGRRSLDLEFRLRNPEAPLYLGVGPLSSFLGLNVRRIALRTE
jgi:Family of unknown function (DUF6311)